MQKRGGGIRKNKIALHCFARCQHHCNAVSQDIQLEKKSTKPPSFEKVKNI